jgi:hypothetical protein
MPRKQFKQDHDPGAPDDHIEWLEGLLAAGREPGDPFDQEFDISLYPTEIYSFRITPWHQGVVIVWHAIDRVGS